MAFRILITGSRYFTDSKFMGDKIKNTLTEYSIAYDENVVIVHGGASGADSCAEKLSKHLGDTTSEVHPAKWEALGGYAGPLRNQGMVDSGVDICLAFPLMYMPNRGTFDCVNRCLLAGIPVRTFPSKAVPGPQ